MNLCRLSPVTENISKFAQHGIQRDSKSKDYRFREQCGKGCTPMTPTKKPIEHSGAYNFKVKELINNYSKIIGKLKEQQDYHKFLLKQQKGKVEKYYDSLIEIINEEKKEGMKYFEAQIEQISRNIELKIGALHHKISLLQCQNVQPFEKEQNELNSQRIIELEMIKVATANVDEFKAHITPFLLRAAKIYDYPEERQSSSTVEFQKDRCEELICEQNLSQTRKVAKKRKYDVDYENIICEENQSSESSMVHELLHEELRL